MRADGPFLDIYYKPAVGDLDYDAPYRSIYVAPYVRGTTREVTYRMYYAKGKSADDDYQPLYNVSIGVEAVTGGTWRQGSEVVSQGFVYVKEDGDPSYTQLTGTTKFSLGSMDVDSYKDIVFKFYIPDPYPLDESAETRHGAIHFKFVFDEEGFMLNDKVRLGMFGSSLFGVTVFDHLDDSAVNSAPNTVGWLLCKMIVLTEAEGAILSNLMTLPS